MSNTQEVQKEKITEEKAVEKLKAIYNEIYDLEQDIKEISDEIKDAGLDAAGLKTIAKDIAYLKIDSLEQKLKGQLALIDRVA